MKVEELKTPASDLVFPLATYRSWTGCARFRTADRTARTSKIAREHWLRTDARIKTPGRVPLPLILQGKSDKNFSASIFLPMFLPFALFCSVLRRTFFLPCFAPDDWAYRKCHRNVWQGRSAPVLGRSNIRERVTVETPLHPWQTGACCARGRAHSGGKIQVCPPIFVPVFYPCFRRPVRYNISLAAPCESQSSTM
jgi:hypothetical protein